MAHEINLPCDNDGVCMRCKANPPPEESLSCGTCGTPWHVSCLLTPPKTLASTLQWDCPDCSGEIDPLPASGATGIDASGSGSDIVAAIRAIEADESLTDADKAKKRQVLMSGKMDEEQEKESNGDVDILAAVGELLKCLCCFQLLERPVTTPCGHNFCLKCFEKWIGQGNQTCVTCRSNIPKKMASNPHINLSLMFAIRLTKVSQIAHAPSTGKVFHYISDQDRPDKAFTTERAKLPGNANAASGKIFVTIPSDHFGPIPAENDPVRNQGVLVGESWGHRLHCRQWGVHYPPVSGIAGQAKYGAQSVVISGGYDDDEDHGEWFLYTGSGGKDLSGNKRTNKKHSSDQEFSKFNEALKRSCEMGYPVRAVRSSKDKHSAYAPEDGVRYDGVYRIEMCWRKIGVQGTFKVCRYLFIRCDNEPAPWTSAEHGDRPRPLPKIPELEMATDLFERKESPSWNFDEGNSCWKWMKPPPASKKELVDVADPEEMIDMRKAIKAAQLNTICQEAMTLPVTTPCAHNFCKACLESKFVGKTLVRERSRGGRTLRAQKNVMKCPCCPTDISDFLQNPQVNREIKEVIEKLKNMEVDNAEPVIEEGESSGLNPEEKILVVSEEGESSGLNPEEKILVVSEEGESSCLNPEEKILVVSEEAEPPKKRIKLDTDAVVSETVVESGMK